MFTPFVVSLASGNLKTDSFRHYIAQDTHFLRSFAKVYESEEEYADDDDDKLGLSQLMKEVLGIEKFWELATPFEKPEIVAYTLGAMNPCMRLHAFLGEKIKKLPVSNENVLDKLSISLTSEELDVIEKLYYEAMKLEIDFFTAQPLFQPTSAIN
ncbi:hypothetical protein KIW84_020895 [Lathyrus oleraceus]|uniref:Thiaminase-2/PQQC domain-containing protein n=1 Tax=Pisum sativum TaxID=3888 RepID=A0A9D5B998_PEA|nr:hypothetical protein KIW84_020895 [Pisum sativum]